MPTPAKIKNVLLEDHVRESYLKYGTYVVEERAVADFRDGLKPVQRRILYAMHDMGLTHTSRFFKCSGTVGEVLKFYHPHGDCLAGDTKIYAIDGSIYQIQDLLDKDCLDVWAFDLSSRKSVPAKAHSFRVGQVATKIYNVELNDGSVIKTTGNHPFLTQEYGWVSAKDLSFGIILVGGYLLGTRGVHDGGRVQIVESVVEENVPPTPMYDFTVDVYENMFVPVGTNGNKYSCIVLHNSSVYSTMVNMVWDRYPTVDGKGNWGSKSGVDVAAAYRYTESRLTKPSSAFFECNNVTHFVDNFDGTHKEPLVLPSRLPFILLNGNSGIAVGITSEIPPHNLTEVQGAVLSVLKAGNKATLETVLQHIKGPDYGMGVLLSEQSDLVNLYTTGEGTLSYRCNYKLEDAEEERKILILTGFSPRFNLTKFIDSCQKMVEAGNLQDVCDESSSDNGIRIVVGYTSGAFLSEHVLPLLETNVAHRFYVTERISESEVKVRLMPLLQIVKEWIDYRRKVESEVLKKEIEDFEGKLVRENARLIGIQNIKIIAKVISDVTDQKTSLEDRLATALKIKSDVASIILEFSVRSLAAANEKEQKDKISKIETEIKNRNKLLSNIDKLLEEKFSKMTEYYDEKDERGTIIRPRAPKLDVTDTTEMYVAVSETGDMQRMEELPSRKGVFRWEYFFKTGSHCWVVDGTGKLIRRTVSALAKGQVIDSKCRKVPGAFSSFARKVAILEKDGMVAILDPTTLMKDEYQAIKTEHGVIAVAEMVKGDRIIVWNKEVVTSYDYDELETSRTNVNGWRALPRRTATGMLCLPSTGVLVGDKKRIKPENIPLCKQVFVVNERNLLIFDDGTKEIQDKEPAIKSLISDRKVVAVFSSI